MKNSLKRRILSALLTLALLSLLVACSVSNAEGTVDLMEDVSAPKIQVTDLDAEKFREYVFDFSTELFKKSTDDEKNSLVSPLSVMMALSMTANGASGNTLTQAEELLGELETLNVGLYYMNRKGVSSQLKTANSIWIKNSPDFIVEKEFLEKNAAFYGADAYLADFDADTVKDINSWVHKNTDGKIQKLLDKLNKDTMMCLINTVLFKADWMKPFDTAPKAPFYNVNGEREDAEMLSGREGVYLKSESASGFAKNYKNGEYSFIALLPNENVSLSDFINSLTSEKLMALIDNKSSESVVVTMPKFSYDYSTSLAKTVEEMGWSDAFNGDFASFEGISRTTPLYISDVIHKTHIKLNENGTEAAAATAVILDKTTAFEPISPLFLTFDRPFMYIIYDNTAEIPVFIGTLNTTK